MTRAAIYLRISSDPTEEEAGVRRQEQDCRELAERLGWEVAEVYRENDTSAFKRKTVTLPDGKKVMRVVRPLFSKMLEEFASGRLNGMIVWDLDRLARDMRDLEDMIDIAESKAVEVRSVTGNLNLSTDDGVTMARVMMAMNNKSSRDTAKRVRSAAAQRAKEGKFHGGRPPYGFDRQDGVLVKNREQAAMLHEATDRILAGDSLYAICADWNNQGKRTRPVNRKDGTATENAWRTSTLRKALLSLSIVGKTSAGEKGWDGILDEAVHDKLTRLLTNPSRNYNPAGDYAAKRSMGGGLTVCGGTYRQSRKGPNNGRRDLGVMEGEPCGKPLYSQVYRDPKGRLQERLICHSQRSGGCGTVTILHDPLEEFVFDQVITALKANDRYMTRLQEPQDTGAADELREQLDALDEQMRRAYEGYVLGQLPATFWEEQQARIKAERSAIDRQLSDLYGSHVLGRAFDPATGEIDWRPWSPVRRRNFLRLVLARVEVAPWPTGVPTTLTAYRGEPAEALAERRRELKDRVLRMRVEITPL